MGSETLPLRLPHPLYCEITPVTNGCFSPPTATRFELIYRSQIHMLSSHLYVQYYIIMTIQWCWQALLSTEYANIGSVCR